MPTAPGDASRLARELTGALPCASCGYDLRGLSVIDVCPECGTPIRATILARVDPYAEVLQPVAAPRLVAAGLLLWAVGALAAALLTWLLRAADASAVLGAAPWPAQRRIAETALLWAALSAIGSLALVRPHRAVPAWQTLAAVGGVACLALFAGAYWRLHLVFDFSHARPYFLGEAPAPERSVVRLLGAALLAGAIVGLRPNYRLLAARSLLLRMGFVDRQRFRAMAAALGVGALGDLVHLASSMLRDTPEHLAITLGNFLIAVGAMLFTLGLIGVALDALRIVPVLLRPPLSLRQITERRPAAPARVNSRPEAAP
jgi:hypothetical protein